MADFFKRAYTLQVGTLFLANLRVKFKVTKSLEKEPNTLECSILNLAAKTRGELKSKGTPVVLTAGYADSTAIIFSGDSRTIDSFREGPDWITKINCGDGEKAIGFARFNASLPAGTSKQEVLRKAIKSLGINIGNSENLLADVKGAFSKGFAVNTNSAASITSLCDSLGLKWSIQDGAVQLRKESDPVGAVAVLLSAETGLLGSPEISSPKDEKKPAVLKAKCFLNHRLKCGTRVEINSAQFPKGSRFRAEKVEHDGDSEGSNWFTNVELKAL